MPPSKFDRNDIHLSRDLKKKKKIVIKFSPSIYLYKSSHLTSVAHSLRPFLDSISTFYYKYIPLFSPNS